MIRPLRQRHRRQVIVLGIFLPVALAVGIAARKPVPTLSELPAALAGAPPTAAVAVWNRGDLFSNAPVEVQWLRETRDSGRFTISFSAAKGFVKPDLMVYWVAGDPAITDALPGGARLLGAFSPDALPVPSETMTNRGVLVLYSLADNEIVARSKPLRLSDSTP
jgi:hypothetical protein